MSGSSGDGYRGPEDSGGRCNELGFDTTLSSSVKSVVGKLKKGDVLDLEIRSDNGTYFIAAVASSGTVAGSIVSHVPDLLRCIQDGNSYAATVQEITGGRVSVRVDWSS